MMAGGSSGQLHIWNLLNDQEVQRVEGHTGRLLLNRTKIYVCLKALSSLL